MDETAEREVYGLLLPIFTSRRRSLSLLCGSNNFKSFIKGAAVPLLFFAGLALIGLKRTVLAVCAWVLGGFLMIPNNRLLPYSTIYLRRTYDRVPDTAKWLPRKDELVKIVVTAAVSGLVGWLIGRTTK